MGVILAEQQDTIGDLRVLEDLPENAGKDFELLAGVIIEMPKPNPYHNLVLLEILTLLKLYLKQHLQVGLTVFGDNTEFAPAEDVLIVPDGSLVPTEQLSHPLPQSLPFMPALAIEVISPSNTIDEINKKVSLYLRYGTQQVWLLHPERCKVDVYTPTGDGSVLWREYFAEDRLGGGSLLPEFEVTVQNLFPALPQKEA